MSDKPPFDPNAPFSTSAPGDKPAFDPSAPFTTTAPESASAVPPGAVGSAENPDTSGPAITWGQGQFSPGLPAVNQAADVLSRSARKNITAPFEHPIDTATGMGRLALGVAQYAGLPGEQFKGDVDNVINDYANVYGSWDNFEKTAKEDPFRILMDATMLASPLGAARKAATRGARLAVPTKGELFDAADGHYNAMNGFGVELHPHVGSNIADSIDTELNSVGYRDYLTPKTFKAVDELRNPTNGSTMPTSDIEGVRRALNKAAKDPDERDAARRAIATIDAGMAVITPADAAINPQFATRVSQEAQLARGNYAAAKRAEAIETAATNAEDRAKSTGAGTNIDNATRQNIRSILASPSKRRGFNADEIAQMRQIVRGTFAGNAMRLLGKLSPSGVVSTGLSAALGSAAGLPLWAGPAIGFGAKKLGDLSTARNVNRLSEMVRARSPLGRGSMVPGQPMTPLDAAAAIRASQLDQQETP